MITIQIFNEQTEDFDIPIVANARGGLQTPISLTDTFDETLDTAEVTILSDGHDLPDGKPYIDEWAKIRLDLDGNVRHYYNTACDAINETRGLKPVYRINLQLLELIFITQYISLDNLCFSNDIAADGTPVTHSIASVLTRLNNQTYTMLESDKTADKTPFAFTFDTEAEWAQVVAPELFFTECTLFQALVRIGEVIGGFPELEYVSNGRYYLTYRIWDSNDVASHTLSFAQMSGIERHNTVDNSATVVDSTVKNMLNASENGENTAVYPLPGENESDAYTPPRTESYNVEITDDNCFIEVPYPIESLVKVEGYVQTLTGSGLAGERKYQDITFYVLEYENWKTLMQGNAFTSSGKGYRNSRLYYRQGEKRIENLNSFVVKSLFKYINGSTEYLGQAKTFFMRITYIPRQEGRLKINRNESSKNIAYIVNQSANIVNAGAYAKYLQGLVNRMQGRYTIIKRIQKRDPKNPTYQIYGKGDFLNGERIYRAEHIVSNKSVVSTYYTSPEWNRRSEYVNIPHKLRQWSIPADEKVTDRNINYSEEIWYSIGEPLPASDGCIAASKLGTSILFDFTQKTRDKVVNNEVIKTPYGRPNLAYIAWKTNSEITVDSDDQSEGYALASCSPIPADTHILMSWAAEDNASMGSRSYNISSGLYREQYAAERQQFVSYPEKSFYLQFKLSDEIPYSYNFNNDYTGTDEEGGTNASFCLSYPLSTKKQYGEVSQTITETTGEGETEVVNTVHNGTEFAALDGFKIEKDLRERILFSYQLDFVGKYGTIVYGKVASWSILCNRNTTELRVFVNSSVPYGINSILGQGTEISVTSVAWNEYRLLVTFDGAYEWTNIAICDGSGKLMFAKNGVGSGSNLTIYGCNRKVKWQKN